jgi:hypothetical protein
MHNSVSFFCLIIKFAASIERNIRKRDFNLKVFGSASISNSNPDSDITIFKLGSRVARWFIFKPKIPIWVNFGGSWR